MRPAAQMRLGGRVALVTGAGSGIGRAIARSLLARSCHLALADRDEAGLAETVRILGGGVDVSSHVLDVADRAAVASLPEQLMSRHGRVDLVFNNAGVSLGGTFEQVSDEDFDWLFSINFVGLVRVTRAFLPLLHRSDDARLVNLSSLYGLIAPPGQVPYAASKFAVRGFSQALGHELRGSTVGVTTVHPGGVATAIARNARVSHGANDPEMIEQGRVRAERMLRMPPSRAGEIIVAGVERRRRRILVGTDAKLVAALERLAPVSYWAILERMVGS